MIIFNALMKKINQNRKKYHFFLIGKFINTFHFSEQSIFIYIYTYLELFFDPREPTKQASR